VNSEKTDSCPNAPFAKVKFSGLATFLFLILLILWHNKETLVENWDSVLSVNFSKFQVAPDLSWDVIKRILIYFVQTLEVALVGTFLGALIALPLALLASDMGGSPMVTRIVRAFLAFVRSIPMIFYCFIISRIFGIGMISGVVAVMIYSLGILSKMFFDEMANLDDTVAHSVMSTGAGRFHVFWYGLLPELLPNFLTFTLLRFEINIREASILGVVGAGGIGMLLYEFVAYQEYGKLWSLILFFFIVVVLIEILCRWTIKLSK
jgi:phosphonate transport system permease protein